MRVLAIGFATFVVGVSLVASFFPSACLHGLSSGVPGGDQTGHFVLVGMTAFLATLAFTRRPPPLRREHLIVPLIVALAATVDELLQLLLPNRHFELEDLAANYAGIAFFTLLGLGHLRRRKDPAGTGAGP